MTHTLKPLQLDPRDIAPAAVWQLWQGSRITAGDLMQYQTRAGGFFRADGSFERMEDIF